MKRIAVLLLCLCMILPMAFVMVFSAGATTVAAEAPWVSTDKAVYLPGDPIMITATPADDQLDWVGIVPADAQGNPLTSYGSVYWEPIYAVGDKSVQEYSHPIGQEKGTALANELGMTRAELLELPAGRYFAVRVPDDMGVHAAAQQGLVVYAPFTIADKISMEKTTFLQGEAIEVTPLYKNDAEGYVGISRVTNDGTPQRNILYTVVTDSNLNTKINIAAGTGNGDVSRNPEMAYKHLPAGRYVVYFVPDYNAGVTSRDVSSDIYIDVLGATVEKTEFAYGDPIMVTGYGEGTDWIGIAAAPEEGKTVGTSIRWRYVVADSADPEIKGAGYGVATDITKAHVASGGVDMADLPAGEYVILSGPNDCAASACHPCTYIPITISGSKPEAPVSATLALNDARTGLAGGKLTVTFAESSMTPGQKPAGVKLYWADAEGNALADYGNIGNRKITGATTEIELTDSMVIPAEAKKLMVVAYNGMGEAEAVAADLPEERGYRTTGEKLASFQIVSDVHINANKAAHSNHAAALFADVKELDPDSLGIFVAGDVADSGLVSEYELFYQLWEESELTVKPYIGIGNHEMFVNGSYNQDNYASQSANFIAAKNAMLEEAEQTNEPYYYINRGGQHFIFLATEYCGTHAYLSDAQLAWLESKLAEVAADGAPVFIMLHQGLYNSVAGTLGNAEGTVKQGWDGVIAGDENFEAWKTESGGSLSDHQKMHGQYEQPLRDLLAQYPSAMMFSGHSHWILESLGNIHEATEAQPNYMFNTASVAYLWTDDDEINGGHGTSEGSQGYFVTVYENCIELRGRDFVNGTWIPGAYYRVWLDCAHEGDYACSTTCKWCGENNPNAVPCDGEFACSVKCIYCGEDTVEDAVPCDGEFDCSTTCEFCSQPVNDFVPCDGEFDCSTKCIYCGEATVTDSTAHTQIKVCDAKCSVCNEDIDHEEHAGLYLCSPVCRWCGIEIPHEEHSGANGCETVCQYGCGTAVQGTGHERAFECSVVCKNCGADMTEGAATHEGKAPCATLCKHGCGTAVTPAQDAAHAGEYACSDVCVACGEKMTPASPHAGAVKCSDVCATCGVQIEPESDHTPSEVLCSGRCAYCDEFLFDPVPHKGAFDCSTVCQYGCGSEIESTVAHTGEFVCSELCTVCGETFKPDTPHAGEFECSDVCTVCGSTIDAAEHVGEFKCSVTCRYGCGTAVDGVAHAGAAACATTCQYGCGTAVDGTGQHTRTYTCSATCALCGTPVKHAEHKGESDCSTNCKYCGIAIEPKSTVHTYTNACDSDCDACGAARVVKSAHKYTNSCDAECNICGYERTPDDHVFVGECDDACDVCGAEREPGDHSFGDWYVAIEPTTTEVGEERRLCTVCGAVEKGELPVKPAEEEKDEIEIPLFAEVPVVSTVITKVAETVNVSGLIALIIVAAAVVILLALIISIPIGIVAKKKRKAKKAAKADAEKAAAKDVAIEDAPIEEGAEEAPAEEGAEEAPVEEAAEEAPAEEAAEEAPAEEAPAEEAAEEAPAEENPEEADDKKDGE